MTPRRDLTTRIQIPFVYCWFRLPQSIARFIFGKNETAGSYLLRLADLPYPDKKLEAAPQPLTP